MLGARSRTREAPSLGAMKSFHRTPALALSFAGFLTQLDVTAVVVAMPMVVVVVIVMAISDRRPNNFITDVKSD